MSAKLCEACKHKSDAPVDLKPLYEDMKRFYPRVYYCSLLNAVKVYNPGSPPQVFECELYEPG